MIPREWACSSAWRTSTAMRRASAMGRRWFSACWSSPSRLPPHVRGDDVGLAVSVADVEHGDDVRMVAQTAHRLCLTADAFLTRLVERLRLNDGDRHVAVQFAVVGQVDALASALAQEALHLIAAASDVGGLDSGFRLRP